jgi:SAM-dependent methyltransferase
MIEQSTKELAAPHRQATASPCPVCGGRQATPFYRVAAAPVTCASLFAAAAEAAAVARGTVELAVCHDCGFVFNRAFDSALAEIGGRYESSQGASGTFASYARSLAADWVKRWRLEAKTVLEIGCGEGEFLAELVRAGVGRAVGLDPLAGGGRGVGKREGRVEVIPVLFDEDQLDARADAVVCRHTLEHIAEVHRFLELLGRWARRRPGRVVLFEVPASERIWAECAFWDVYYEHCNYFTAASLRFAFARAGFDVRALEAVYGGQYLLLEARAAAAPSGATRAEGTEVARDAALAFGDRARAAVERAPRALRDLARQGPLVLWQGAAKTVGFLTTLDEPGLVHNVIDLNPHRHGLYLPGCAAMVVAPGQLAALAPRNVVLMNPAYVPEVEALLRAAGSDARLWTVNQICGREAEAVL